MQTIIITKPGACCPKCAAPLADADVRSINGQWRNAQRKVHRGGRPKKNAVDQKKSLDTETTK